MNPENEILSDITLAQALENDSGSALATVLEHRAREREWVSNAATEGLEETNRRLAKENIMLKHRLNGIENRLLWILHGNSWEGEG